MTDCVLSYLLLKICFSFLVNVLLNNLFITCITQLAGIIYYNCHVWNLEHLEQFYTYIKYVIYVIICVK